MTIFCPTVFFRLGYLVLVILLMQYPKRVAGISPSDSIKIERIFNKALDLQNSQPDSCYKLVKEAYVRSQKNNYFLGISKAFVLFGALQREQGRYDSAMLYFKKALDIRIRNQYIKESVSAYYFISHLFSLTGKKDSAFYYLYEGLRTSSNDSLFAGWIYTHLGNLYCDYNDTSNALKCFTRAHELAMRYNDTSGLIQVNTALGNFYYLNDEVEKGLKYFENNVALAFVSQDESTLADSRMNAALCYTWLENYKKAQYYYQLALEHYTLLNKQADIARVYYNQATLYMDRKMPDSAITQLNTAINIYRLIGDRSALAPAMQLLAEAYANKGNFLKAYELHLEYSQIADSLLNAEKVNSIAEMQTKYETEKKEQQISLLDAQGKTRTAQRNFFIAGSAVLLLGLFILALFYLQRNKLAKKNALIAEQKIETLLNETELKTYNAMIEGQEDERKRIASDLHDRLGSMLATVKLLFSSLDTKIDTIQKDNNEQFSTAKNLLDEACSEVRRISHNLSSGIVMSFGLVPALEELCHSVNQSKLIKCKLMAFGMDERLDQSIELGVYRMVQEVFSNILKHAKATRVTVQLNHVEGSLNVTIEDDGTGFNVEEKRKSGGMGLQNLEKRAAQLNGIYTVDSHPGKGTISIIEIPTTI